MATVTVDDAELTIRLSRLEKLASLHADLRIPRAQVESVSVAADPFRPVRGIRAPGTGLPGIVALGRWRHRDGVDLVLVRRREPAVVLELAEGAPYRRVLVSAADADAVAAAIA